MRNLIKIAVAVLIMAAAVPRRAQEWKFATLSADELLDTEAMDAAVYETDEYTCVISFTHSCLIVTSEKSVFDYRKREYYVRIGLYDTTCNLVEKYKQFCYGDWPVNYKVFKFYNPNEFFGRKRPRVVDKIIEWLASGAGYVRMVAPRFQETNLEIILPGDKRFTEWVKKE